MRESLNLLAVIVLVIFYCFATDITGNSPKFYDNADKPEFQTVSFIQAVDSNSFFYLTQKENAVNEPIKLPVTEIKKLSGPCLSLLNQVKYVFESKLNRHHSELCIPHLTSKIFQIIFPFNFYW